jgi:hypothetical protein
MILLAQETLLCKYYETAANQTVARSKEDFNKRRM